MSDSKKSYTNILKATSLFGGVQIVTLLISLIRSKFLAIFIGPLGYGIYGLLNSSIDLVRAISSFGLETSGVKKIAEAKSSDDEMLISKQVAVFLKLSIISGVVGTFLAIFFSKQLSIWNFGNSDKYIAILLISVAIFFKQLTNSKNAIFQGLSKLKYLAKSNLIGNIIGLVITLPLFVFFKVDAIVPSIILTSFISFIVSYFFYKKLDLKLSPIKIKEAFSEGKEILYFGGLLSISGFLPILSNYMIQIFIHKNGSLEQVGLFSVGLVLINSYVGLVFNAMSTEYYPRLATLIGKKENLNAPVNQQAIISILIIIPIIVLFLGFSPILIKLLFSIHFIDVIPFIIWAIVAMFFKAISWSMGMVIIAKADSKVFVKTSIIFNALYLGFCLLGYHWYGLEGLGIGFLCYYIFHFLAIYVLVNLRYQIKLNSEFFKVFLVSLLICLLAIILLELNNELHKQLLFVLLFLISLIFTFFEINKRVNLLNSIRNRINRKK